MITQRYKINSDINNQWFGLNDLIKDIYHRFGKKYKVPLPKLRMLEIGSYMGESTAMFASSMVFSEIHCIDPFVGKEKFNDSQFYDWEEVYEEFKLNTRFYDNIKLHMDFSYNIYNKFEDGFFDFIYIDANHEYDEVKKDIELYLPKLASNGIIGGHDYHEVWPDVVDAVNETVGEPTQIYWDSSWIKDEMEIN